MLFGMEEIDIPDFTSDVNDKLCDSYQSETQDPAMQLDILESALKSTLDAHAPVSSKEVVIRPQQVWYTPVLKQLKGARRKAEKVWRKTPKKETVTLENNWSKYQVARDAYNSSLDNAKCVHYNEKITDAGNDSREVSRIVKSLLHEDNRHLFHSTSHLNY